MLPGDVVPIRTPVHNETHNNDCAGDIKLEPATHEMPGYLPLLPYRPEVAGRRLTGDR